MKAPEKNATEVYCLWWAREIYQAGQREFSVQMVEKLCRRRWAHEKRGHASTWSRAMRNIILWGWIDVTKFQRRDPDGFLSTYFKLNSIPLTTAATTTIRTGCGSNAAAIA
jgi:hypothetical protein